MTRLEYKDPAIHLTESITNMIRFELCEAYGNTGSAFSRNDANRRAMQKTGRCTNEFG